MSNLIVNGDVKQWFGAGDLFRRQLKELTRHLKEHPHNPDAVTLARLLGMEEWAIRILKLDASA